MKKPRPLSRSAGATALHQAGCPLRALVYRRAISYRFAVASSWNIEGSPMVRTVAAFWLAILCGLLVSFSANAANDNDAAALKKATADCQAQVKEYAKYNDTSWYGRRKMMKQCVK